MERNYINIKEIAEAKGLKSTRSLRLQINKPNSPYIANFDHERLREILGNIKGRFLLSYDDSPKIRELYKDFEMVEVERLNGINNKQGTSRENKIFKELLIANYPIKERHHAG